MFFSTRMILALAAGAGWFLLSGVSPVFLWLGMAYNGLLIAFCLAEWRMLADSARFRVRREVNDVVSMGASNSVRIIVHNNTPRSFGVRVRDEPPVEFAVDRKDFQLQANPGEIYTLTYHVVPPYRGGYQFQNANLRFQTFFGLLVRQQMVPLPHSVKVYPDIQQTHEHQLLARRNRLAQMGLRVYRMHGKGMEFERLRDYVPDDDLRKVDWKASARRAHLVTREYNVERSQNIILLLDCGRTMASKPYASDYSGSAGAHSTGSGQASPSQLTKLDYAINACVMLTYVAVQSDDRVGLLVFADETVQYLPPGRGRAQLFRVTEALAPLQPRLTESNYRAAFHGTAQRMRKRSLVIVLTDLVDPDSSERLISHMRALLRKHLVLCVALSDYELPELIDRAPESADDLYRQSVALAIMQDRRRALRALQQQGVIVLDATPKDLTVSMVNKYLEIKREGRV